MTEKIIVQDIPEGQFYFIKRDDYLISAHNVALINPNAEVCWEYDGMPIRQQNGNLTVYVTPAQSTKPQPIEERYQTWLKATFDTDWSETPCMYERVDAKTLVNCFVNLLICYNKEFEEEQENVAEAMRYLPIKLETLDASGLLEVHNVLINQAILTRGSTDNPDIEEIIDGVHREIGFALIRRDKERFLDSFRTRKKLFPAILQKLIQNEHFTEAEFLRNHLTT